MNEIIRQNSKLKDITFTDIFNLNEIQNLQDLFADVHGVASIITDVKGNPLTKASNFSRLCETIIRKTEKGCANCYKSDAIIGKYNPEGATLQPCLSGGLLDAGASITVGGIHIANWLIGQVRNENTDEKILLQYADEIGVDRLEYKSALDEIPIMSVDKFKKIANLLFVIATDLSEKAFTNLQLKNEIAASNQAQQALEESKEKFALAFKTSPYAITITRPEDGMFIEVNDAFFSISGYTPEEALNNSSIGLDLWVDADDRNRVVKVLRDGGKVVGQEFQFKKKNGEIIIGFFSANLISINNSTYILSSINDITERKQTEIALKQSEEKYHELFEANKDGITIFNAYPDGRLSNFLEMNESAGAMLGYTKTELSTMNPSEIEIDVTEEKMGRRLNDLQTKGFSNFETILKHKNGSTVLVEITVLLINYNKFPALMNIVKDITEHKQSEIALKESEMRFKVLFDDAPDAMLLADPETGKIIDANNKACSLFKKEKHEIIGLFQYELHPSQNEEQSKNTFKEHFDNTGQTHNNEPVENKICCSDGTEIPVEIVGQAIHLNGKSLMLGTFRDITKRKLAEEETKKTVQHYQALIEKAPDGIALIDAEGNFKYISPSAKKMFGYLLTDEVNGNPAEYTHPDDLQLVLSELGKIFADPLYIPTIEYRYINKQGQWHWVETTFSNLLANPSVKSIVLNFRDITERKQNEEKLIKSEERYAIVIDASEQGIWDWNVETNEVFYSEQWKKQIGYKDDELKNDFGTWIEHLHPEEAEYCQNAVNLYLNNPIEHFILEFRFRHKDGTYRWIHNKAASLKNNEGKVIRMFGSHTDITERKQTEIALKQNEEKFRNFFENTIVGMSITSIDGNLTVNNAFCKIVGYSETELNNLNWKEITHLDDIELNNKIISSILKGEKQSEHWEKRYIHKDGHIVWVDINTAIQRDDKANPLYFITAVIDITKRKNAEQELRKSEERYSNLLLHLETGIVVHAPDTSIITNNPRACELLELTSDQMKGKTAIDPAWKFVDVDNTPLKLENYPVNRIVKSKSSILNQILGVQKSINDDIEWLTVNGFPVLSNEGEITEIVISFNDITERKNAEFLLENERALYLDLVNTQPAGIYRIRVFPKASWEVDAWTKADTPPYKIELISDHFCEILEIDPQKFESHPGILVDLVHPDDKEEFVRRNEEANALVSVFSWDCRLVINNNIKWIHFESLPRKLENGDILFTGIIYDITDSKNAEEELIKAKEKAEESEEKYRLLFENANEAIYIVQNEKLVFANPACEELTEISKDNLIGFSILDLVDVYDKENLSKHHHDLINGITQNQNSYFTIINQKGEKRHLSVNSVLINWNGLPATLNFATDITERKNAELGLKDKEKEYRNLIEFSPIAMSIIHDWKTIYFNPAAIQLFGAKTQDELIGKHIYELIHPDFHNLALENSKLLAENGFVAMQEQKYLKLDGTVLVVETQAKSIRFNNLPATLVVINDITERKQSEQALRESEERYKALHNASFGGIAIHDKGKIFECNQGLSEITGYSYNELIGMDGLMLIAPESRNLVLSNILSNYEKPYEAIGLRKNGEEFPLRLAGKNIPYKGKTFRTVEFRDITERKYLEKIHEIQYKIASEVVASDNIEQLLEFVRIQLSQLTNTENFFAALYNAQSNTLKKLHWVDEVDSFDEWDAGNSFSGYVVKTAKALLVNKQEIAKISIEQNIPILGEPAECWLGAPLIVEKKVIGVLVIQSYKDPMAYNASFVMLFEQLAQDLSVFIHKTTILNELKIANFHAQESDRLKSAFLANMSHEIRTPMNGILGFAELLKEPNLSGQQQQEYIRIIEKSGNRMLNIINDIVDISKIEAGLMKLDIKETNINEQIEYIYNFFKPEAEAKGLKLSFSTLLPAKESIVKTDREKVYAILTNLVKNAIKYTNVGTIEIGYSLVDYNQVETKHDRFVLIFYVKDTGIGIPKDKHEAIFERFIQADIACKMAYQGAGLGLSITKAYVEMLGGKIWVESEEEIGSTFYFTLPYNQKQQRKPEIYKSESLKKWDKIRKLKILIAEDDEISEMLIEITVNAFSKETLKARTGIEAIEACKLNPDIDLVLMDIQMPKMGGYEATRQIRNFNKNVIIIAQTAFVLSGDRHKAIEAGCNDYIAKPINKDELLLLIQNYFG